MSYRPINKKREREGPNVVSPIQLQYKYLYQIRRNGRQVKKEGDSALIDTWSWKDIRELTHYKRKGKKT